MLETQARQVEFPAGVRFSPPVDHRRSIRSAYLAAAGVVLVAVAAGVLAGGRAAMWCALAAFGGAVSVIARRPRGRARQRAMWASLTLRGCDVLALIEADGGVNASVRYRSSVASVLDGKFKPAVEHTAGAGERVVAVALGGERSVVELHDPVGVLSLEPADAPGAARLVAGDGDVEIQVVFAQRPGEVPAIVAVVLRSELGELRSANPDALGG
jgi:hypothetical protein